MNWIPIDEDLPEVGKIVLVADILNSFVSLGKYSDEEDCFLLVSVENVEIDSIITHWMPLPEPPK